MSDEQLYTLKQVMERLQISESTVHRKLKSQKLSGFFLDGVWRFSEQQIQAFMRSRNRKDNKGVAEKRAYNKKEKTE